MQFNSMILRLYVQLQNVVSNAFAARRGQSMIEYAIICALIAVLAIGAVTLLGGAIRDQFTQIAGAL